MKTERKERKEKEKKFQMKRKESRLTSF